MQYMLHRKTFKSALLLLSLCVSGRDGRRETDVSTRCRDPEAQMFRNTAPKRDSKHACHVTKAIRSIGACHKCFETCIPAESVFN